MDRFLSSYLDIPPLTRTWMTVSALMSLMVQFRAIAPLHIIFDKYYIYKKGEYWRLFSSFVYFGRFNIHFLFSMFALLSYSGQLERNSFRARRADYMLFVVGTALATLAIAHALPDSTSMWGMPLLGPAVVSTLMYIWARRNPFMRMSIMGLVEFPAPVMPFAMMLMGALMSSGIPVWDIVGILLGHTYWFLEDVYPRMPSRNGLPRGRVLAAPRFLMRLLGDPIPEDPPVVVVVPETAA
ncbi:Der1-like family-domain-containing protein, partial [Blastocladiella britannica]